MRGDQLFGEEIFVVQVEAMSKDKVEGALKRKKDAAQLQTGEERESQGEPERKEQEEVPLEKMDRAQLIEKIKETEEKTQRNFDLYLRSQADIENIKKRFQKEKLDLIKFANESLIKQLVTVIDNLDKAIAHAHDGNSVEGLKEGVELTSKGLMDILSKAGLEEVKAKGEPFDPNFHEAMFEREDDSVKPGTVLEELQKGYTLNDRLIRPAMVSVSKAGSKE